MYKAIIADDEASVRNGLKRHFDWQAYGIEVVADFPDGQKAFDFIQQNPVDLVITDVRMPHLDGIELSKLIHERFPKTKIIFVSGYEDTEYLRNALKMDAVDYILKSIDLDEFAATISKVTASMNAEIIRDQSIAEMEKKLEMSIPLLQQRSLMLLISDDFEYEEISRDRLSYLGIPLQDDICYCVIVLQIRDIWRTFSDMNEHQRLMFSIQFQNEMEAVLRQHDRQICFENRLGEYVMILDAQGEGYEDMLLSISEELSLILEREYGMHCRIGISERFKGLDQTRQSYENAVNAIHKRYYLNNSQSISVDKFEEIINISNAKERADKEICEALLSGDMDRVKETLGKTFEDLEALPSQDDQQNFMIFLLLLPTRVLSNIRSGEKGSYDYQRKLLERFLYCADQREQKLLLLELYEEVTALLNSRSEAHPNYIIDRTKQLIDNSFKEQISIASLAEEVYLTPTYLCTLFKQTTGHTINEYLTDVRIYQAKKLLGNPQIKLYDVCDQVGYLSPSYFSKIFKRYTGMTPSEYRDASLNQL